MPIFFWARCKKNSNFVCYERGACWQLPSLMRFLFDLKYDANEIQNFPFVGGVCADVCFGRRQTEGGETQHYQFGAAAAVPTEPSKVVVP